MSRGFKLKNGSLLLSTEAAGGIYNSTQLEKIASLCQKDSAIVKVTEDQRLALFVTEEDAQSIAKELAEVGLGIRNYREGLHQPTSCIGELCPEYQQDALGAAMQVTEALSSYQIDTPLRIGINGCAKCCVPCHTLDISVIGDENGYRISLGGKTSQLPEMATFVADGVPPEKLAKLLDKVVDIYKKNAKDGESLQDVMERCGSTIFIEALAPYSQDAHIEIEESEIDLPLNEESVEEELTASEKNTSFSDPGELSPSDHLNVEASLGDDDINPHDFNLADHDEDELSNDEEALDDSSSINVDSDNQLPNEFNHDEDTLDEINHNEDTLDKNLEISTDELDVDDQPISDDFELEESEDEASKSDLISLDEELDDQEEDMTYIDETEQLSNIDGDEGDLELDDPDSMENIAEDQLSSDIQEQKENDIEAKIVEDIEESKDYEDDSNRKERDNMIHLVENQKIENDENIEIDNSDTILDDDSYEEFEEDSKSHDNNEEVELEEMKLNAPLAPDKIDNSPTTVMPFNDNTGWHIESFDMTENQNIVVTFSNKASVEISKESLKKKGQQFIKIGSQKIQYEVSGSFIWVLIDGIKLSFPLNKAS